MSHVNWKVQPVHCTVHILSSRALIVSSVNPSFRLIRIKNLFSPVLSLILVYLLRLKPGLMVWVLLIGFTAVSLLFTIALWVIWMDRHNNDDINAITPAEKKENKTNNFFVLFAIISSTVTIGEFDVVYIRFDLIFLVICQFQAQITTILNLHVVEK